jgi:beta-lactam-binding protein with PASTA domain
MGALTFDPAPEAVVFADATSASETLTLTAPATVRRTFALGEVIVQAEPEPTVETPKPVQPTTDLVFGQGSDKGGVQRCTVPRVRKGATVKAAQSALKKAGCKVGSTRNARSSKVKKGRVVSLSSTAGKSIPTTTRVHIKVSRGRH